MSFSSAKPAVAKSAGGQRFEPPVRERANSAKTPLGPGPTAVSSIQQRLDNLAKKQGQAAASSTAAAGATATVSTAPPAAVVSATKSIQERLNAVQNNTLSGTRQTSASSGNLASLAKTALSPPTEAATAAPATTSFASLASAKPARANSQPAGPGRPATTPAADSSTRPGLPGSDVRDSLQGVGGSGSNARPEGRESKSEPNLASQKAAPTPPASQSASQSGSRVTSPDKACCPACGNEYAPDASFCRKCGRKRDACPACGSPYLPDAAFCRKCGRKRDAEASRSSSPTVPKAITPVLKVDTQLRAKESTEIPIAASAERCMPLLEEYLRTRYDPIIDTVKALTDRVEKARKLLKRERIRYKWDDKENIPAQMPHVIDPANVHVIICALDYIGTSRPLTCTKDGDNMQELCRACGVTDVSIMYNRQANREAVAQKIQRVGSRCRPGDYFVFFYAGHGANVRDEDGDEDDGKDEAFCFVTDTGKLFGGWMTDDQFASHMTSAITEGVKVLVISDCCHSGTICDFDSRYAHWGNVQAASLSGCKDYQTSGDTGSGGIFTHSLLLALEDLVADGKKTIPLRTMFSRLLDYDDEIFDSAQDITLNATKSLDSGAFLWPFVPKPGYKAPWQGRRKKY